MSVQTIDWLICIALTAVGSIGLSYSETAARLGRYVSKHTEVPFGTLVSLAELIGGLALGWYWLGYQTRRSVVVRRYVCGLDKVRDVETKLVRSGLLSEATTHENLRPKRLELIGKLLSSEHCFALIVCLKQGPFLERLQPILILF